MKQQEYPALPEPCFRCDGVDWVSTPSGSRRCVCERGVALVARDTARVAGRKPVASSKPAGVQRRPADVAKAAAGDRDE
jgi:hypothetical protein